MIFFFRIARHNSEEDKFPGKGELEETEEYRKIKPLQPSFYFPLQIRSFYGCGTVATVAFPLFSALNLTLSTVATVAAHK